MKKKVVVKYKDGNEKLYIGHKYEIGFYFVGLHEHELDKIDEITLRCYPLKENQEEVIYKDGQMPEDLQEFLVRHRQLKSFWQNTTK